MRHLYWTEASLDDRDRILTYIARDSPATAVRMDDRFEAEAALLLPNPNIGRVGRLDDTRELMVRQSPYLLIYRIERSRIAILRVLHGAQRWPEQQAGRHTEFSSRQQ